MKINMITDNDIKEDYKIYCENTEDPISFTEFEKVMKDTIGYAIYDISKSLNEIKDKLKQNKLWKIFFK